MLRVADEWDVALWAVAGYIALVTLVRLMLQWRQQLVNQFRAQVASQRQRRAELFTQGPPQPDSHEPSAGRHKPAA